MQSTIPHLRCFQVHLLLLPRMPTTPRIDSNCASSATSALAPFCSASLCSLARLNSKFADLSLLSSPAPSALRDPATPPA